MVVAELPPNATTGWHTPPALVFLYVIEGRIVYEVEAREPREYSAGMAFRGPGRVKNPNINNSASKKVTVITFQLSDPSTPLWQHRRCRRGRRVVNDSSARSAPQANEKC
jgi:hypothetical protein